MIGKMWWDSRLPGTYSVMDYGHADYGGGAESDPHAAHDGRERDSASQLSTGRVQGLRTPASRWRPGLRPFTSQPVEQSTR